MHFLVRWYIQNEHWQALMLWCLCYKIMAFRLKMHRFICIILKWFCSLPCIWYRKWKPKSNQHALHNICGSYSDCKTNGPFLTVNQSMFTEVELANQWHCRAQNNICPTLHKRTCAFLWSRLRAVDPGMNK